MNLHCDFLRRKNWRQMQDVIEARFERRNRSIEESESEEREFIGRRQVAELRTVLEDSI